MRLSVFFIILMIATPAFAQNNDMRALMSRLEQMQRQMDTISKQVYRGDPPAEALSEPRIPSDNAGLAAAVDERMSSLEGGMRQLNNRMDEQDYAIGQLKQELALFKNDLEIRLKDLNALPSLPSAIPLAANEPARAPAEDEAKATMMRVSGPVPAGAVQDSADRQRRCLCTMRRSRPCANRNTNAPRAGSKPLCSVSPMTNWQATRNTGWARRSMCVAITTKPPRSLPRPTRNIRNRQRLRTIC
jgi:hypothetical protein